MINVEQVDFCYKRHQKALNQINLSIESGEFIALIGRNGSGKTTLSRIMMALLQPTAGRVLVDGDSLKGKKPSDVAGTVGYVFQNPDLQILAETVAEEVAYGPVAKGLPQAEVDGRVAKALAMTGLSELADVYPRALSYGQKRRLAVAAALALKPKVLILDEITGGQDAIEKQAVLDCLKRLNEEQGVTIILITHDMSTVLRYADRAIVMAQGKVVFDGVPQTLFAGQYPLTDWGLSCPPVAALSSVLFPEQPSPVDPAALCRILKEKMRRDEPCD